MSETNHTCNVAVPGTSIYVGQRGSGPTLLLIPGGAQDAGVFAALPSELSDQFSVIAHDRHCNSRSPCDDRVNDLNVDAHADDAAAVITAFGDGPVVVFDNAGGAQVGLNLAARHPALVTTLTSGGGAVLFTRLPSAPKTSLNDPVDHHGAKQDGKAG